MRLSLLLVVVIALAVPAPAAANEPPRLERIQANFVEADKSTYYRITATDPEGARLEYTWSLQAPPDEPGCTFFMPDTLRNQRVWRHGSEHGCTHVTPHHQGVVSVVVSDGTWNCTATYHGTATGPGDAVQPCTPGACAGPPGVSRPYTKAETITELGRIRCDLGKISHEITSAGPDALDRMLTRASNRLHGLLSGLPRTAGISPGATLSTLAQIDADLAEASQKKDTAKLRAAAAGFRRLARLGPARARVALRALATDCELLRRGRDQGRIRSDKFAAAVVALAARKRTLVGVRFPKVFGVKMIVFLNAVEKWDRDIGDARTAAFFDDGQGLYGLLGSLAEILENLRQALR